MSSSSDEFVEHDFIINQIHTGDLIEINRGKYRHWAICVKIDKPNIWCFHVSKVPDCVSRRRTNENVPKFEACVIYETLKSILINTTSRMSKCRINNQDKRAKEIMDKEEVIEKPYINVMIQTLHDKKDQIVEYDPKLKNCEHYVTSWKYGIGFSSHSNTYHKLIDIGFGATAGISGGTALAATGLTVAGFTTTGIAGGSAAAAYQSSVGSITAGSTFAVLQSLGATGTIAAVGSAAIGVTLPLLAVGGVYYYWRRRKPGICQEYTINK